jgi:hypothetical protein
MRKIHYVPIIKTGDAEIRGLENLSKKVKKSITPLFELTRSRKSKKMPEGSILKRIDRLEQAFGDRRFIVDLTGEPNLTNTHIRKLRNNKKGYSNWVNFAVALKEGFPEIIPVIQISDEGVDTAEEFYKRIGRQVKSLDDNFDNIVYRFPVEYEPFKEDLRVICDSISSSTKILCVVDAAYVTQRKAEIYSRKAVEVINELETFSVGEIILTATSFPQNPIEHGGDEYGDFVLEEVSLYRKVKASYPSIIYGDYATINPVRRLQAGGRGWVPRIDMPIKQKIYYYRSRKKEIEASYGNAYIRVAKKVKGDQRYEKAINKLDECWGVEQIELAAQGYPQGLSPSFWISVRMNVHMTLRKKILLG